MDKTKKATWAINFFKENAIVFAFISFLFFALVVWYHTLDFLVITEINSALVVGLGIAAIIVWVFSDVEQTPGRLFIIFRIIQTIFVLLWLAVVLKWIG